VLRLYTCLTQQHDPSLLLLAAAICGLGSYAMFLQLGVARGAAGRQRAGWTAAAAAAGGITIWSTHFVAMLAFEPGVPVSFTLLETAQSLLAGIVLFGLAAAAALRLGRHAVPAAGLLIGAAIAATHYVGMTAYDIGALVLWDFAAVAASLALGLAFSCAAIWVKLGHRGPAPRAVAAALLALAIGGVHFVGMSAMTVLPDAESSSALHAAASRGSAIVVSVAAALLLLLGLTSAAVVRREQRIAREEAEHMRSMADAAIEGLLISDDHAVVASNRSVQELLGQGAAWFAGRRLDSLLPDPVVRAALLREGGGSAQAALPAASGEAVPVELVCRPIRYLGRPHRVLAVRDLRDRRRAEARIQFLAHHDPLTRLPNRAGFAAQLGHALELRQRTQVPFAVLTLDLDRFKVVNDTLGHAIGDALLVKAAARLRKAVRSDDMVCRVGGDEFSVVQLGAAQPEGATALAQRLVDLLSRPFIVDGQVLSIGTSVGIALCPPDGQDAGTLTRSADLALYRAKAEGRGTYRFFETEMDTRMQRRRLMEVELRTALALRQFHLVYQPLLDVGSDDVVGFEALLRWSHPQRGLIPPGDFIPLAEETGLIVPIGEWALREACQEAARWPMPASVAVNLSSLQFRSPGLVETIQSACRAARLDPRRLELEITETVLLTDSAATLETLRQLKALGVRISMDDFGTGYSSLSYLRSFPFDKIKIDRSFVSDVTEGGESTAIVRAIIGLGRSLGMQTTVEGVETEAQLLHVRNEGCDQVQGYHIGRPLAPGAVQELFSLRRAA
jgi:diguanylate cyclase (GGDEF)-like protein